LSPATHFHGTAIALGTDWLHGSVSGLFVSAAVIRRATHCWVWWIPEDLPRGGISKLPPKQHVHPVPPDVQVLPGIWGLLLIHGPFCPFISFILTDTCSVIILFAAAGAISHPLACPTGSPAMPISCTQNLDSPTCGINDCMVCKPGLFLLTKYMDGTGPCVEKGT